MERLNPVSESTLPVVETFHSLQGEGIHGGRSAFFIRLGGCSVGCSWCDTKQSWPRDVHPKLAIEALRHEAEHAAAAGAAFVVITGGEPLEHNLAPLCKTLQLIGVPLHLETSGVGDLSGTFHWITLSPKPHRPPSRGALATCHELKVVVHAASDLSFAEAMAAAAIKERSADQPAPQLLLQPGWESPEGQQLAIDYVRSHPQWRLSLQSHKWLGVR